MRRPVQFRAAVRSGRRGASPGVVVHVRSVAAPQPSAGVEYAAPVAGPQAVGFVVGKSVGSAVIRNRVKRQLRHLVAARLAALPAGATLVVRALPAAAGRDFGQLSRDFDAALHRALR